MKPGVCITLFLQKFDFHLVSIDTIQLQQDRPSFKQIFIRYIKIKQIYNMYVYVRKQNQVKWTTNGQQVPALAKEQGQLYVHSKGPAVPVRT